MAATLIKNIIIISCHIGVHNLPCSVMDKHHKVTVTQTGSLLLRLTLSFTAGSTPCPRGFSFHSYTIPPPTDKLHYSLAERAQHLPTTKHVYIFHVGMGINSSDFPLSGFHPNKPRLLYGATEYVGYEFISEAEKHLRYTSKNV